MRAVAVHEHGGPDHLVFEANYPDPTPGPGDVIVRVKACSLNYHDIFTRRGMPGIKLDLPVVPGLDLAGEIAEVGPDVEGWNVGDRVLVDPRNRVEHKLQGENVDGGLAEYSKAKAHQLVPIPDGVSFAEAASLPVAYGTAHRMMVTIGKVKAGEKVLVLGASGGVGTGALLLAKNAGAEVVAAGSSEEKLARLEELGADHTIDYTKEEFHKAIYALYGKPHRREYGGGCDVVVNFTGGDTWVPSFKSLGRGGRLLTCGATSGPYATANVNRVFWSQLEIVGSTMATPGEAETVLELVWDGTFEPRIRETLPMSETGRAHELLENREGFGKVVVIPDSER